MSFAQITVVGNLGQDPEVRYLPDNTSVVSFSIAHTRKRKNQESTTWYRCSLFGKRGDTFAQYTHKGSKVLVTGEPFTREYQAKDGSTKVSHEIAVNDFAFLDAKGDNGNYQPKPQPATAADVPFDDDIPF